jgi:hypothetical protein
MMRLYSFSVHPLKIKGGPMKKNIMILTALTLSILCVVGFQPNSSPQYRIVECDKNDAGSIQNKINQNSKDG